MTSKTLCVLALDAADHRLIERWNLEHLQLATHGRLSTFALEGGAPVWDESATTNIPYTLDVWPAVATGRVPDEARTPSWDNPALKAASRLTDSLPMSVRRTLGAPLRWAGADLITAPVVEDDSVFTDLGGVVDGWPGISEHQRLDEAWSLIERAEQGTVPEWELRETIMENFEDGVEWLEHQSERGVPVAGTHVHILDVAGHAYATDEEMLRENYEKVDQRVGYLASRVDRLLVLSDHGMQVSCLSDEEPGVHSWEAHVASTGEGPLPKSVLDVRRWIADRVDEGRSAPMDAPTEHLRDLGYISGDSE